jgi:diadenosine tetraphosphate (Ap4A) HIT family hydrolase
MPEQQQMTEEQAKAMQEKLKQMSPEELKEFQKKQCIFCQIIDGKVASKKIYEDDICVAILDINPSNPGHVLLMPKEHYPIMPMIPEDELAHLSMVAKALSHTMLKALKAQGTTIFIANGIAAGQRAQHFMMHVIPRKEGDKLPFDIPQKEINDKELIEIKKAVQEKIFAIFKIKKTAVEVEARPKEEKKAEEKKEEEKKEKPKKKAAKKTEKKKPAAKPKKPAKKKTKKEAPEEKPEEPEEEPEEEEPEEEPEEEEPEEEPEEEEPEEEPEEEEPEEEEPEEEEGGIGLDEIASLLK